MLHFELDYLQIVIELFLWAIVPGFVLGGIAHLWVTLNEARDRRWHKRHLPPELYKSWYPWNG
jgi:hypothetical protein